MGKEIPKTCCITQVFLILAEFYYHCLVTIVVAAVLIFFTLFSSFLQLLVDIYILYLFITLLLPTKNRFKRTKVSANGFSWQTAFGRL